MKQKEEESKEGYVQTAAAQQIAADNSIVLDEYSIKQLTNFANLETLNFLLEKSNNRTLKDSIIDRVLHFRSQSEPELVLSFLAKNMTDDYAGRYDDSIEEYFLKCALRSKIRISDLVLKFRLKSKIWNDLCLTTIKALYDQNKDEVSSDDLKSVIRELDELRSSEQSAPESTKVYSDIIKDILVKNINYLLDLDEKEAYTLLNIMQSKSFGFSSHLLEEIYLENRGGTGKIIIDFFDKFGDKLLKKIFFFKSHIKHFIEKLLTDNPDYLAKKYIIDFLNEDNKVASSELDIIISNRNKYMESIKNSNQELDEALKNGFITREEYDSLYNAIDREPQEEEAKVADEANQAQEDGFNLAEVAVDQAHQVQVNLLGQDNAAEEHL